MAKEGKNHINEQYLENYLNNPTDENKELLAEAYLPLSEKYATKIHKLWFSRNNAFSFEDAISAGYHGLCDAIRNYVQTKGKFSTYLYLTVMRQMDSAIQESIGAPRNYIKAERLEKRITDDFYKQHGRYPDVHEIQELMGMNDAAYSGHLRAKALHKGEQSGFRNADNITADVVSDQSHPAERMEVAEELAVLLQDLDKREKTVYVGIVSGDKSKSDLAKELAISNERVAQIFNKAKDKVAERITENGYSD